MRVLQRGGWNRQKGGCFQTREACFGMRRKGRNVRGWVAAVNDDEGARGGAFGDDDEERGSARGGRSRGGGVDEDGDDEVEAPLRRRGRPPKNKNKKKSGEKKGTRGRRRGSAWESGGTSGSSRRFVAPRHKHHISTYEEDSRMEKLGREAYNIGARSFRDGGGSSTTSGGYESFVKFCKKYGRSVPERALLRCQRALKTDLHVGTAHARADESDAGGPGVHVTLTGNGDLHDVAFDAALANDPDALSEALTDAAKEAYASSKQSMLALGLDTGANMGYRYPTADMLYPERFAYLDTLSSEDASDDNDTTSSSTSSADDEVKPSEDDGDN